MNSYTCNLIFANRHSRNLISILKSLAKYFYKIKTELIDFFCSVFYVGIESGKSCLLNSFNLKTDNSPTKYKTHKKKDIYILCFLLCILYLVNESSVFRLKEFKEQLLPLSILVFINTKLNIVKI